MTQINIYSRHCSRWVPIDLIHKSQNAPVPYPTMQHPEQKCAHFCSECCIVGYGTGAFWDLWNWSIVELLRRHRHMSQPLAIVTTQRPIILAGFLWTLSYHNISLILGRICGSVNFLASAVIINWRRAMCTTWIKALIILQWRDSMRTTCNFSTELIRNLSIWFAERQNYVN